MGQTIWGETPLSSAVTNVRQMQQMEASGLQVQELRTQAGARLAERAAVQKYTEQNPQADMSSITGRLGMYSRLMQDPATRSNPVLMEHVFSEVDQLRSAQAQATKADMDMHKEELTRVGDALNTAMLDPTSEASQSTYQTLIGDPNLRPELKSQIRGLQSIFAPNSNIPAPRQYWEGGQPKTFSQLSPEMQSKFKNDINTHYLSTKDGMSAAARAAGVVIRQNDSETKRIDEQRKERKDATDAALKREHLRVEEESLQGRLEHMRASEEHLRDKSPQLAKSIEDRDKALRQIEDKQSKILQTYGIASPDEVVSHWFGSDTKKMSPADQTAWKTLDNQKQKVLDDYEAKSAILMKADQLQPRTPPTPTKGESVTVGGQVFNRPAAMSDDQWKAYKKAVGAK